MVKEELYAKLDQLLIDQMKYNTFCEYTRTFTDDIRCKKGCLEFTKEVFNLPQLDGLDELGMRLVSSKSSENSIQTLHFIMNHQITLGYNEALVAARVDIMKDMAEYIKEMSVRLAATELEDKYERQVYLRRAVARLIKVFQASNKVPVYLDQWSEVEPAEYINYLGDTLDELTGYFNNTREADWSDAWGSYNQLHERNTILSVRGFLDYLDTFLKY